MIDQGNQGMMDIGELREKLRSPWPVLDCHVHPLDCFGFYKVDTPEEDAERLVASAKRSGIVKMILFSLHRTTPREPTMEECREANDWALAMTRAAPDVFLPFCYVNPMFPSESVDEIDRCVGEGKMCGVKLWVSRRATDPGLDPITEKAIALDVPMLQHAWIKTTGNLEGESFPSDVADLASRHPRAKIIMAHLNGIGLRGIEDIVACENVVVDVSGGDPESCLVEIAVDRLGHDRVVYGSDAPIRHHAVTLGKVLGSDLTDDQKKDILWNNVARLLPRWAGIDPLEATV
jgi:predicted TIM-barrel fold metal-dependent hydrolase